MVGEKVDPARRLHGVNGMLPLVPRARVIFGLAKVGTFDADFSLSLRHFQALFSLSKREDGK